MRKIQGQGDEGSVVVLLNDEEDMMSFKDVRPLLFTPEKCAALKSLLSCKNRADR